ncbi:ATP-binding protein, partial [Acidimicrobiia bacterium]|nr:ATP-binding protein [Acidimicrobiia bacterium]
SMRRDFIANVSHELKTPIGAVSLLAETLSQEDDPDTTSRLAKRLEAEAQRLGRIVDDILDLSRIEGQAIEAPDVVELNEVVNEAVDRLSTFASRKKVEIKTKLNANTVEGDRLQLISLVHNIIENAVKYSEENSQVEVTLDFSKDSSTVCLNVIDSGIGIPEIEIERVFERFYRVDRARSRQSGGTGLGLSIVRNVATRHGGSVKIDSVDGEGTTVTVDLPVVIPYRCKRI